jgi:hypothetical protein
MNNRGITLLELLVFIAGMVVIVLAINWGLQLHDVITEDGLKFVVESIWYGKGG